MHAYLIEYLLWSMHVEVSLFGVEIESVPLGGESRLLAASVHAYHISICDQKYNVCMYDSSKQNSRKH